MIFKTLSDISEVIAGQSPPSTSYNITGEGLPFFQGKADFGPWFPKTRFWCSQPKKISNPNDILISVRAPVGPTNINKTEACIGRGLSAIRCNPEKLYFKYLIHYLRWIEPQLANKATGSTFSAITQSTLKNLQIPLPPLSTQKKIADLLDTADALRQRTQAIIDHYDQLAQSLFLEMFGDPVKNPMGWEKKPMADLMTILRGGSPRPIEHYLGGTFPWIKIGDGSKGNDIYITKTKEHITKDGLKKTRLLPDGSLIFANCGVSLGFARIITFEGCIHDGWLAFSDISTDRLNKIFLLKALNSITRYFRETAPDGTQPNLNTSIMKRFNLILPSISLQNQFAESIALIEQQKDLAKKSLEGSENLFNALLQKAFKGEIEVSEAEEVAGV
ncbi:restriction endonuclease subunit S [Marinilabilia salmonicolor]|uniref:restriction endonuclease subunit S n=1 Tax=Marinilabilia salmonicolor TaxID=989 RepID=UPI00029A47E5|nr:restriction endonuclease subunit S [Marinilabilia salmonicolor]